MDEPHKHIAKRAMLATSVGDWHQAILCYQQLCQAQPTEPCWRRALVDVDKLRFDSVLDPESHYAKIKAQLQSLSAESPADAMALYVLGYAHLTLTSSFTNSDEEFRLAEEAFQRAVDIAPDLLAGYSGLRLVCSRPVIQGSSLHDKSIQIARLATSRIPACPGAWIELGNALSEHGNPEYRNEAVAAYQSALALDSQLLEAHFKIACVHRANGDVAAAICAYERVVDLDPTSTYGRDAQRSLAHLLEPDGGPPRSGASALPVPQYVPQFKSYAKNEPRFVPALVPKRNRSGETDDS